MPSQFPLPLEHPPSYARDALIVSDANAEAVRAVGAWPNWHGGCLVLVGPPGAGKSHLAAVWAEDAGAAIIDRRLTTDDLPGLQGRPLLLESADGQDDEILFHLINQAGEPGRGLLMTSRSQPSAWPSRLPDLRSRLNALPTAFLGPPDDAILQGALLKLFRERHIRPADDLLPYLLRRMERSIAMARELADRLSAAGYAQGRPISRALARDVLESDPELQGFADPSLAETRAGGENDL